MRPPFLHRRRAAMSAAGIAAACAAAALSLSPAYAGANPAAVHSSPATAPLSGHRVAGAVYGAAAVRAAGSAAADFRRAAGDRFSASGGSGKAPADQLHEWWGSFPKPGAGTGVMATQSVSSSFRLSSSGDIMYAPTMDPRENSCIEVVTVHTTSTPQVWGWDWCKHIAPGAEINIDSTFLSTYTTTVDGQAAYTMKDVQTSTSPNTWTAYLFNQTTQAWDTFFTSSGTSQTGLSSGWDMFEMYSATNPATGDTDVCDDLANSGVTVASTSVESLRGGTWHPLTKKDSPWTPSAHPNPATFECPNMHFTIIKPTSAWSVNVSS